MWKLSAAVVVIGAGLWASFQWHSLAEGEVSTATPGSVDDPVVTKSYVDQKIAALNGNPDNTGSTDNNNTGKTAINIVDVPPGQTLIAKDGAQAVVRAGRAVAYSADSNGIADVTDGTDIQNGSRVPNNHLILFPRGGRGLMPEAGQKNGLTVMVMGAYEVKVPEELSK
ncbi:hypothetical protein KZ483_03460 [Paenibacillus sp. sptzw28]|uniref:hypothetical protein n=1 Tax=Paenibacillus sp. sptzw28 TaxID=715179 RepID=UPI001C6F3088|nr:hypothetical protein [Paenibacillus sp. sptzw28]QYR22094.1 hypothetical protein KZ483_03460 [Paenibacillus sp. sptzw28]